MLQIVSLTLDPDQFFFVDSDFLFMAGSHKASHLSNLEWYAYMIFERKNRFNPIVHARKLFKEFLVDTYLCVERNRLCWYRYNQKKVRAELYCDIVELLDDDIIIQGKRRILPSTFIGGPRHMDQLYQDVMALVIRYGNPSLFITITANTSWPEIQQALTYTVMKEV